MKTCLRPWRWVRRGSWLLAALVVLNAATAEPASMVVYTCDGLTRVRPLDPPQAAAAVSLKAARNEYEPFQIIVHAGAEPLSGVNIEAGDLVGERGQIIPRRHLTLYREHYLEVTKPSPKSKEGPGRYPDALIPFVNPLDGGPISNARFVAVPFDVAPQANQPVWVDVCVPKATPPGKYAGTLTVTARGQKPVTVAVALTVWNFTLPDTPSMRSNFGGLGGRVARLHNVKPDSQEFRALERHYAAAMAAHRLCPPIPRYLMPEVRPDGRIDATATHAALKEWMDTFHVTGVPLNLLGGDPLGKDRARNLTYLPAIYAYLQTNGWAPYAYIYVLDEPNDARAYAEVRRRAQLIHQAQPGIQVLCTEQPTPQDPAWGTLVGSVDIWVPLWTLFEEPAANQRLAAGEELWSYTALCQGGQGKDTPYWEMDFPLLDYRIPGLMSWRYRLKGLLYWTTVYWEKAGDVWTNPATYGEGRYAFNGEGSLFYPGADAGIAGPVPSMRLKQIREGLEDYEYCQLLAQAGQREFASQTARRLARSWTDWEERPSQLEAAREELARRLEARAAPDK